jgi:hypothetical protein
MKVGVRGRGWAFGMASLVAGALLGVEPARAQDAPVLAGRIPLTREQVVADLLFFRDQWAPREQAYNAQSRARMLEFVNSRIASARPMEKTDLALIFSRAMAFTGNNHTNTPWWDEVGAFEVVPVSFWWFPEGAIVTRAHPDQRDLLGAEILAIGGVPVREAMRRVSAYIPGTPNTHLYESPAWLRRLEVLRAIGLAEGRSATFRFRLADGRRITRRLMPPPRFEDPERYPDPAQYTPSWRQSIVPGRGPEPWPHVLERLPSLPLHAQAPTPLAATELDGGRILYVRSTGIYPFGPEPQPVESLAFTVIADAVRDAIPPRHAIIDLRYNEGGNFLAITNFVAELVRMTAPDGRLYVLSGRATNSAAIAFAALLKGAAPDRTRFVGEHPSDAPTFWSEGGNLTTPAGIPLRYNDGFHDWASGCRELSRCFWPVVYHGTAIGSLAPDIPVEMRYADFAAGRDPVLDAALADIAEFERRAR